MRGCAPASSEQPRRKRAERARGANEFFRTTQTREMRDQGGDQKRGEKNMDGCRIPPKIVDTIENETSFSRISRIFEQTYINAYTSSPLWSRKQTHKKETESSPGPNVAYPHPGMREKIQRPAGEDTSRCTHTGQRREREILSRQQDSNFRHFPFSPFSPKTPSNPLFAIKQIQKLPTPFRTKRATRERLCGRRNQETPGETN